MNRWPGLMLKPMLSRTPCSNGNCPESIDVCEGSVCGEWA
jgi:hypothetical protein